MSGTPSFAEIHGQLTNTVAVLERLRAFVDGSTYMAASGAFDTLIQSLEGTYTPAIVGSAGGLRAALSDALSPGAARSMLDPILFELGRIIGFGGAYTDTPSLMRAVYEYFHANTYTVEDRAITFDTSFTAGGTNVGNGACSRLTTDGYGYPLQACHVEQKILRCRRDENSGVEKNAEEFEIIGAQASLDNLLVSSFGSGLSARLRSHHAGTGAGGSLLNNSSFDTYSASATNKFTGWVASGAGASGIVQETGTYYRTNPSAGSTNGALRIPGTGGTVTLAQSLSSMRIRQLDPETPYFYRIMLNKTPGTASGGSATIRMGSQSVSIAIADLGSGWQELLIGPGTANWLRNFNEADLTVEVEWAPGGGGSGYLLVDDAIFAPWDLVDGTYWFVRGNAATHTPWKIDDTLEVTDTGGAPATAKVQWWLWRAGLGYLPSTTGTPTVAEPS